MIIAKQKGSDFEVTVEVAVESQRVFLGIGSPEWTLTPFDAEQLARALTKAVEEIKRAEISKPAGES